MSDLAIACMRVVKRYADLVAVNGLDLEIHRGECFGLLGPNGAGKTTTVEILEGLSFPDDGVVEVLGLRWGKGNDHALRSRIGVQLQETRLPERLTVVETIRLFRSFYAEGRDLDEIVALLGLESKRDAQVQKLSGGQKQRLALACTMAGHPELIFLDEPTTGLDPQARRRIWDVILDFRSGGGTVLLTTHQMDEAEKLCDRVAIMDKGQRIALGTPADLILSLGAEQIVEVRFGGRIPSEDLIALPGVTSATHRNDSEVLAVSRIKDALPALVALASRRGLAVEALSTHQASLEDVFIHLTGRGLRDA